MKRGPPVDGDGHPGVCLQVAAVTETRENVYSETVMAVACFAPPPPFREGRYVGDRRMLAET